MNEWLECMCEWATAKCSLFKVHFLIQLYPTKYSLFFSLLFSLLSLLSVELSFYFLTRSLLVSSHFTWSHVTCQSNDGGKARTHLSWCHALVSSPCFNCPIHCEKGQFKFCVRKKKKKSEEREEQRNTQYKWWKKKKRPQRRQRRQKFTVKTFDAN